MKLKVALIIAVCGLSLLGCSNEKISSDSNNKENQPDKNNTSLTESNKSEDKTIATDNSKPKDEHSSKNNQIELKIYTRDQDDNDKKIEFSSFNLANNKTLNDLISELCTRLQKDYFKDDNAKIKLEGIDNKNIATINLINEVPNSWDKHFSGSAGGFINQSTIIDTLLQREYKGDWIKGVKILIDGKDPSGIYDHASFEDTFYR